MQLLWKREIYNEKNVEINKRRGRLSQASLLHNIAADG